MDATSAPPNVPTSTSPEPLPSPEPNVPQGAACLLAMIEHIEAELPKCEPETKEQFETWLEEMRAWGEERYPDVDFGAAGGETTPELEETEPAGEEIPEETPEESPEEEPEEEPFAGEETPDDEEEEDEDENLVGRYHMDGTPRRTKGRNKQIKRAHRTIIKDAAAHLHEMADLKEGEFKSAYRKASRAHANDLEGIIKGMEDEAAPEEKAKLIANEAGKRMNDIFKQEMYKVTGNRKYLE